MIEDGRACEVLHDDAEWDGIDEVYVYMGMEYNGSPNMFDGLSPRVFERMDRFVKNSGRLPYKTIEAEVTDLFLRRMRVRVGNKTTDARATPEWIESLVASLRGLPKVTQHDLAPRRALVVGDSHSIACWRKGAYCKRMDGKTMRGLSKTLVADALEYVGRHPVESVTVCAGNIDVRHHLFREHGGVSPKDYLEETLVGLVAQVRALQKDHGVLDIELTHALPVEDESRHLRKSVCLDGSPFTGSRQQRAEMVEHLNGRLDEIAAENGWRVFAWPKEWYVMADRDPKWFFTKMEKPYSVHLSREFYRWQASPPASVSVADEVFG